MFCLPQAIENNQFAEFQEAVKAMTNSAVPTEYCLDVCEMIEQNYPMTLLAFAGYHGRKVILEFLLSEGARKCRVYRYVICSEVCRVIIYEI